MKRPSDSVFTLGALPVGLMCLFVACNGDDGTGPGTNGSNGPPPLAIASRAPGAGAQDVSVGATVEAVFNQEIDPATLTATSFQVMSAGSPLPLTILYEEATHAARAIAPLLPGTSYTVELSTAVRSPADSGFSAPEQWSFATAAWEPTTVDDTPGAGGFNSLAIDADGRLHVSYRNSMDATLEYATCVSDCKSAASWQTQTVASLGFVAEHTSLAVDADRRIHVSYRESDGGDLRYATCVTNCTVVANWEDAAAQLGGDVGFTSSLAVDGAGRVHISHYDGIDGDLDYATCASDCANPSNWQATTVDATGDVGAVTSIAVDAAGGVHVTYYDITEGDLRYATCPGGCQLLENWTQVTVDSDGDVGRDGSLHLDATGRLHVSYLDATQADLKYATCAAMCTSATDWRTVTVDAAGDVGELTSLAVDENGRVHATYIDNPANALKYATCAADCDSAESWRTTAAADMGSTSSLAVDDAGDVHVVYWSLPEGELRYIR